MLVCVPVTSDGQVDPRWGRAGRVAVADVRDGTIASWHEFEVGWGELHETGTEGSHHARVARFLMEQHVEVVMANHMGEGMLNMLQKMGLQVRLGALGDARRAVTAPPA